MGFGANRSYQLIPWALSLALAVVTFTGHKAHAEDSAAGSGNSTGSTNTGNPGTTPGAPGSTPLPGHNADGTDPNTTQQSPSYSIGAEIGHAIASFCSAVGLSSLASSIETNFGYGAQRGVNEVAHDIENSVGSTEGTPTPPPSPTVTPAQRRTATYRTSRVYTTHGPEIDLEGLHYYNHIEVTYTGIPGTPPKTDWGIQDEHNPTSNERYNQITHEMNEQNAHPTVDRASFAERSFGQIDSYETP